MTLVLLFNQQQGGTTTPVAATEAFGFTESASVAITLAVPASETFSNTESPSAVAADTAANETHTQSEGTTALAQTVAVAANETHTQSEGTTALAQTLAVAANDSWTLTDASALLTTEPKAVTDSTAFSEGPSSTATSLAANDAQAQSETPSTADATVSASETHTQNDPTPTAGQQTDVAASETHNQSEGLTSLSNALSASDSTTFTDAPGATSQQNTVSASEAHTQSELAATTQQNNVAANDSWAFSEVASSTAALPASDSSTFSESAASSQLLSVAVSDSWTLSELAAALSVNAVVASDSLTLTESLGTGATAYVPIRSFNGTSDIIIVDPPTYFHQSHTVMAVVQRNVGTGYEGIFTIGGPANDGPDYIYEFTNTGIELVWNGRNMHAYHDSSVYATTNWQFVAMSYTRNVGSAGSFRFHQFDGTTWTHAATNRMVGVLDDTGPTLWVSTDELRFGNWNSDFNWLNGRLASVGLALSGAFSDAQIEALGTSYSAWSAAGLDHLWEFNQTSASVPVADRIGSLNERSHSGTTAVSDIPVPSTLYSFGASSPGISADTNASDSQSQSESAASSATLTALDSWALTESAISSQLQNLSAFDALVQSESAAKADTLLLTAQDTNTLTELLATVAQQQNVAASDSLGAG
jgi:hypothetical protein